MNSIKNYINFTYTYAKKNILKYILIISIVFIFAGFLAFFTLKFLPMEAANNVYLKIQEIIMSKNVINQNGALSFWGILINNLIASIQIIFLGFIPLLFLPFLSIISNSVMLGAVMGALDVLTNENILIAFIKYILPHGIFEIPAIIISGAIGVKLCAFICRKTFGKATEEKLLFHIKGCIGIFIFCVIPLLIIAAFIEAVVLSALYL